MSAKIAKTIARQKEKIAEGQFYEAHQQFRVITYRYLKSNDYASAADILSNGALLLLRAGQGGSGGDLARMLLDDVYNKGEYPVTDENRQRVVEILRAFPPTEPTRKRFVQDMMAWSSKYGEYETGDPQLHHEVGSLFAEEGEPYDAERHLLLGTTISSSTSSSAPSSAKVLANLHFTWYELDSPHTASTYAARSVLPYLLLGNLSAATTSLSTFTSLLVTSKSTQIPTQTIESSKSSVRIFSSLPLLNFLSLLLLACQKGDANLFRQLTRHYGPHLKEVEEEDGWGGFLAQIGEVWFGIRVPRQNQGNPLFDMMGSMLFGGGGAGGGGSKGGSGAGGSGGAAKPAIKGSAPVQMDLD